jgi:Mg2+-importing ATPase
VDVSAVAVTPAVDVPLGDAARMETGDVLAALASSEHGLTSAEVERRRAEHGANTLPTRRPTAATIALRQLRNPLLLLLTAAAVVSALTGELVDSVIIMTIVVGSTGLGFVNEYRSEQAVAALHAQLSHRAVVWRDEQRHTVDVRELVPGDVVDLSIGDLVPADVRLLSASGLECEEAVLTGESTAARKTADPTAGSTSADLRSCAFMGTVVRQGSATAVVVATGERTMLGQIATGLTEQQVETGFQRGLRSFSTMLVAVAGTLTAAILVINLVLHRPFIDAVLFSLAIAIGITPQLLPAIVSVSLASGARMLARRRVLVKRLVVIEDLGNIDVLFTDKTGTLTDGTITFETAIDIDGRPSAEVLTLGLVCNDATRGEHGAVGGTSLDRATWDGVENHDIAVARAAEYTRVAAIPFDHDRQMSSVIVTNASGRHEIVVKGSPESVMSRCAAVPSSSADVVADAFRNGQRVVALARRCSLEPIPAAAESEHGLELAGFLVFADRPKREAAEAIERLTDLGVDVKVITGDNGTVAARVCAEIGLPVSGQSTGAEVDALSDEELAGIIPATTIFARVNPLQKARIVTLARQGGRDVGFLGDGVNDAVALHAADVGISVDTATDVAKDAADVIVLEKDLDLVATGIAEGRRIFANTLKYVLMATSSNFGNMFSAAGASLFLNFLPMLPSQILLNNLLYDVGQMAIPTDRVDPETVARPTAWDVRFVRRFMAVFGPISSLFDFATFFVMLRVLDLTHDEFRAGWFVESLVTQTLVVFLIRTRRVPWFRSRPSALLTVLPCACATLGIALVLSPVAHTFGFETPPAAFFVALVGMAVAYAALVEAGKLVFYRVRAVPSPAPRHVSRTHRHHRRVMRRASHYHSRHRAHGPRQAARQR